MPRLDAKKASRSWLIGVGILVSILVMGAGLAPIYFLPADPSGLLQNVGNLGQFVSGLFAPLAFIWVVIAVMLQSRELELQREELANSRRALELQHEELRKTVEQHIQQTKIMTEDLDQKYSVLKTNVAEEIILQLCARLIDIGDDLSIHGEIDRSSPVLSPWGPTRFTIGDEAQLLAFYREKNYGAFFDYVYRNIISAIGLKEQQEAIVAAARDYGGGGVGRTALAGVTMLFHTVQEMIDTEKLTQLDARLNACNFYATKVCIEELQAEISKLDNG